MPANLVKTKADGRLWAKAKEKTEVEYPKLTENDDEFWEIVVSIFKNMKKGKTQKDSVDDAVNGVIGRIYRKLLILNTVLKIDATNNRNIR